MANFQKYNNMAMKTVTIVMAIYNPDPIFFERQLKSLDNQTYENITFIFIDDCSNNTDPIINAIKSNIKNFDYKFITNTLFVKFINFSLTIKKYNGLNQMKVPNH